MRTKWVFAALLCFLILALSPFLAAAEWTDIHQIQSSSHSVTMTGDGYYMDPSNAYDGIGSQSGDPVILRTQTCFTTSTPSAGTTIEIDYILATNQSSNPFNLIFNLVFIADTDAPDGYASVSLYNENTLTYVEIVNSTTSGGADYNISRSSSYMDDAGNINLKLKSGHSVEDCAASTETRVYEFEIYADPQQQVNTDADGDGVDDEDDSCPNGNSGWASNPATDYDNDGCQDSLEDEDDDNDGLIDLDDSCPKGDFFTSLPGADYDGDGCKDDSEDNDDDGDSIIDFDDLCPIGKLNWSSINSNDYDSDGCNDIDEDNDDDNDNVSDIIDSCSKGNTGWTSTIQLYFDNDCCLDAVEDNDDDNDDVPDIVDSCQRGDFFTSLPGSDYDGDGCKDSTEDDDDDGDGIADTPDNCPKGILNWSSSQNLDYDGDGCRDQDEDPDDDGDGILDTPDNCPEGILNWESNNLNDWDSDGCLDAGEDPDDDSDGILDTPDNCPKGILNWESNNLTDWDGDGCLDAEEDNDDDDDGILDTPDNCPKGFLNWESNNLNDWDSDGCLDAGEDNDDDNDGVNDTGVDSTTLDNCRKGILNWESNNLNDWDSDGCLDAEEDWDDDGDGVNNTRVDGTPLDNCRKGFLNWTSNIGLNDRDGDGCLDTEEDWDDDGDGVNNTRVDGTLLDNCTDTPKNGIVDPEDGCPPDSAKEEHTEKTDTETSMITAKNVVVGGVSLLVIIGAIIAHSIIAMTTHIARRDEFEDPTSQELIDKLEAIQGNLLNSQPLYEENNNYRELVKQMQYHLESHKLKYPEIITSAGFNVLDKMKNKTFTLIGAALFLRAILTCIARIHLERLNSNEYKNKLLQRADRRPSGHQIVHHFYTDIITGRVSKSQNRSLRKWLESFDDQDMFRRLNERVQIWSAVVHVEDTHAPSYKVNELEADCELLLNYSRALATHPPWPLEQGSEHQ